MGHLKVSTYYHWQINKLQLLPFGGNIEYKELLNRPIKEECYIVLAGPLCQFLFYLVCYFLFVNNFLLISTFTLIKNYHYALLIFNLLPIYPLDGSKLLNLLLNKFVAYKTSNLITIYVSFIVLFVIMLNLIFLDLNICFYLLLFILLFKTYTLWRNQLLIFNKFLLERYLYNFHFPKLKLIYGYHLHKLRRDKKHLFYINNKWITERALLKKRFTTI